MVTSLITGDIINSRRAANPEEWLSKLKGIFNEIGPQPKTWEIMRGDAFQLEVADVKNVLKTAIYIKATIKSISGLDVRMAIGIGEKSFDAPKISEANGEAFIYSGELFDRLKKINLAIKSPWEHIDEAVNICLELALLTMNSWTSNSAETVVLSMDNPAKTQQQLSTLLNISQGRISERQKRAGWDEIMKMEAYFRRLITKKIIK